MNINNTLQTDLLDILFLNKNKSYGAYELRKTYNKRLLIALLTMALICCIFSMVSVWQNKQRASKMIEIVTSDINLEKAIPHPKEEKIVLPHQLKAIQVQHVQIATIKVTTPKIVADKLVTETMPTQEMVDNLNIDVTTQAGKDGDIVNPPVEKGTGDGKELIKEEDYTKQFYTVQQEATFPGGLDAWTNYLRRNLRSEVPTDNGAPVGNYTVVISFFVNREGNVSDVKAENDPGYGTAAEAVRVIQRGPAWQPAVQNGHAVLYRQTQSITFQVQESQ